MILVLKQINKTLFKQNSICLVMFASELIKFHVINDATSVQNVNYNKIRLKWNKIIKNVKFFAKIILKIIKYGLSFHQITFQTFYYKIDEKTGTGSL